MNEHTTFAEQDAHHRRIIVIVMVVISFAVVARVVSFASTQGHGRASAAQSAALVAQASPVAPTPAPAPATRAVPPAGALLAPATPGGEPPAPATPGAFARCGFSTPTGPALPSPTPRTADEELPAPSPATLPRAVVVTPHRLPSTPVPQTAPRPSDATPTTPTLSQPSSSWLSQIRELPPPVAPNAAAGIGGIAAASPQPTQVAPQPSPARAVRTHNAPGGRSAVESHRLADLIRTGEILTTIDSHLPLGQRMYP